MKKLKIVFKEFKPTSWSIDNRTSIFVLSVIISIFGILSYNSIPKEQFPDIVIPTVLVNTIYPGTSPADMENLVTRPIEKNLKSINGVKKITSSSVQDFSSIVVEFNTGIEVSTAKQKVKDAVDKTKTELPNDLLKDPMVSEIDLSEMPIMTIHLSGDIDLQKLKKYAELARDRIESFREITRVDIIGALDREIQVDVDMYKMQAASASFYDIKNAITRENVVISGGTVDLKGMRRSIRIIGEFKNTGIIENIAFKTSSGATIKLRDIAEINDGFKEKESFARLDGNNVIALNIIKKSGENLLNASDKIAQAFEELKKTKYPEKLKITVTGDQSKFTRSTLHELNNTIIIGFILVTIVLMFFMGLTNAVFVGFSVPLSMALAYLVMPGIGYTMNMLVMFAFIFALGIVVDDAIVVIENTHRIFKENKGKFDITQSAKYAAGEVFVPILSGTLTTLAPFFPLIFWPGVVGKFMHFIPVVLIITLFASLVVAYIINPVFAVRFMKHDDESRVFSGKRLIIIFLAITGTGALFYLPGIRGFGNFIIFVAFVFLFHNLIGKKMVRKFQHSFLPAMMKFYEKLITWTLRKKRSYYVLWGTSVLLFFTFVLVGIMKPKIEFFPESDPQYVYAYIKLPVGTDVKITDSLTAIVEGKIRKVIGENNPDIESVISNVALGASESPFDRSVTSNKGKVTLAFVSFADRKNGPTTQYLDKIREAVKDVKGAEITVDKNKMGPPAAGKPVNIEVTGDDIDEIIRTTEHFKKYLDSIHIPGIEQLKSDFDPSKPEIVIEINRERANREGISTGQIGMEIRTAVLGDEISKYREGEDQYPILLRYGKNVRNNIDKLMNLKIVYRDMNTGMLRQIPLAAVARIDYSNTVASIQRKNVKRVITISSNILTGFNANVINNRISELIPGFVKSDNVDIRITGEQEDQQESAGFLSKAMLLSLFLILFIMITQFNSIGKPLIIIIEVLFSLIGVLLGFIIFDKGISIAMTGMGVVALAGIVVRNGILLVEFTDVLKARGHKTRDAIIQAGKTRITPVLLTATATILGLLPLAIGFNIDFEGLFTHLEPNIHIGSDISQFFSPLALTIIFGLSFATFLTLLLVPSMYLIMYSGKIRMKRRMGFRKRKMS